MSPRNTTVAGTGASTVASGFNIQPSTNKTTIAGMGPREPTRTISDLTGRPVPRNSRFVTTNPKYMNRQNNVSEWTSSQYAGQYAESAYTESEHTGSQASRSDDSTGFQNDLPWRIPLHLSPEVLSKRTIQERRMKQEEIRKTSTYKQAKKVWENIGLERKIAFHANYQGTAKKDTMLYQGQAERARNPQSARPGDDHLPEDYFDEQDLAYYKAYLEKYGPASSTVSTGFFDRGIGNLAEVMPDLNLDARPKAERSSSTEHRSKSDHAQRTESRSRSSRPLPVATSKVEDDHKDYESYGDDPASDPKKLAFRAKLQAYKERRQAQKKATSPIETPLKTESTPEPPVHSQATRTSPNNKGAQELPARSYRPSSPPNVDRASGVAASTHPSHLSHRPAQIQDVGNSQQIPTKSHQSTQSREAKGAQENPIRSQRSKHLKKSESPLEISPPTKNSEGSTGSSAEWNMTSIQESPRLKTEKIRPRNLTTEMLPFPVFDPVQAAPVKALESGSSSSSRRSSQTSMTTEEVRRFVDNIVDPRVKTIVTAAMMDDPTLQQHLMESQKVAQPIRVTVDISGLPHMPNLTWLWVLLATVSSYLFTEIVMAILYGRHSFYNQPHWSPGDPSFPFVLLTKVLLSLGASRVDRITTARLFVAWPLELWRCLQDLTSRPGIRELSCYLAVALFLWLIWGRAGW